MVKLILISLHAIVAINAMLSTNVPAGNGVQYIGSFRSRMSVQGRSTQLFDESNYCISQNWGACNTAQKDCKNLLNANLLAVETEEEWKYVREMLKNYGFATAYWTSGEYARTDWRWSANDIALTPFAPWESGHPKKANPLLSVLINYRNRYDATWSTVPNTQLHRYISEVKVQALSPIAQPCYQPNDLVVVLDSSGSIGRDNFEKAKQIVERLTNAFTGYSHNRVSFVTYSFDATVHIDLESGLSPAEISSKILETEFEAGFSTNTHRGIELALHNFISYYRGVPMNMVIFTGVESNSPYETADMAERAIKYGIRTFSIGITPYMNQHELLQIAGNDASHVFTTENFDGLMHENMLAELQLQP